ncbi:salt tolerance down-regulator-domain-containing protein [Stachybotrys elegans]|uniref:Stress response protein NST1 n=1 Tax=Stachybotrys elegans TaxID=80388 RepID=A0A8K0SIF0_9HYPO|nr:salt tolerance down-regulator-domain-containing protein [Stachybotrys elegans]
MPANHPKTASPMPASPRNTSKYTNKDGSKFITVPKGSNSESSQPSTPTTARHSAAPTAALADATSPADGPAPTINRKKQKRRQKAAAKAAAEQANGHRPPIPHRPSTTRAALDPTDPQAVVGPEEDDDDEYEHIGEQQQPPANGPTNGHPDLESKPSKKSKKKKKKGTAGEGAGDVAQSLNLDSSLRSPMGAPRSHGISRDKIWSTSSSEERERIKEFWLGLGEEERKSLVKVEKDAVLKKMKEQQKHTCSCTVCGRKRTAIEEELEGLYDAYYDELEQFANQGEGPPMLAPPPDFALQPPRRLPSSAYARQQPPNSRIVEHMGDDDDEEELDESDSEDEVEDDEFSDDEPPEQFTNSHDRDVADFLTFGNSLQVKGTQLLESFLHRYGNKDLGGILTVADDLLKNDGKRFIEMMEQLAERRMAREEDAREHFTRGTYGHPPGAYSTPHSHPPPVEEDYEEDGDEEEDYDDSQEEEEYEDDEVYCTPSVPLPHAECCCQDPLNEQQRMEEGRRMFQIFAARMFEQRVLSAYKEKVAKERQQKLLEELEEESRQVDQQKAKKAKNAQKKKDKAAQKKQAQAEEKARKEAEKAAEEASRLEAEQKRAAEQRQRAEEKRKQKEAQKKAEEEARLKKEADRQRRIHEQREKQAEQERKAREAKDREKKLKEEQRLKEKGAREQREREALERKEKQERDKREKEARAAKAQKEAQEAREAKERAREERAAAAAAAKPSPQTVPASQPPQQAQPPQAAPRRTSQQLNASTAIPHHPPNPAAFASPKIPVATPVIPKAPTPMRPRTTSQQYDASSVASLPETSKNSSPHVLTPVHTSPNPYGLQRKGSGSMTGAMPPASHSVSPPGQPKMASQSAPFPMPPPMGMQPPPGLAHAHAPPPGFPSRVPHDPLYPPGFRSGPSMVPPLPAMAGPPSGRAFSHIPMPPPGFPQASAEQFPLAQAFSLHKDAGPPGHSRQGSSGFDGSITQPIGRPAPIGRPGSVVHGQKRDNLDDETTHLGSRALIDDDEPPLSTDYNSSSLRIQAPGPRSTGFASGPFMDSSYQPGNSPWGSLTNPPAFPPPNYGWGMQTVPPGFNHMSPSLTPIRPAVQPGHVAIRLMLCHACKDLSGSSVADADGYIDLGLIKTHVDSQSGDPTITEQNLLDLCETEGSALNGGGTFEVRQDPMSRISIRWVPDASNGLNPQFKAVGAPGEIGSPLAGHASLRSI